MVFPVLVLIATAAALGPWTGFFSAGAGVLLSALTLFSIGRVLGQARACNVCSGAGPREFRAASSARGSLRSR